ncbi:hypothetical protein DICPUDRAFT_96863 [Dictyostelium purpureum]|uniref:B30.2/SPRY domain-containing protein n=1 Tax=Dictyostelium purpureum TaxID=5786 RepID=F0ZBU6_DICPU|nr:uncharacterized protein DICPUDRAFT_96863 [Dictyostelium purpureum]EGC38602.1 hypothetical protein DICPUDRAFT_96863 [Dictyostelium purpureum]|eukprot:XP_003284881.1 hypothetical protein DICPUDRAFT_96863 [Dictyostelium purpureum]
MDLHNEDNKNDNHNIMHQHHHSLQPIINDAPTQQQYYRQEHENIQHHLIPPNNSHNNGKSLSSSSSISSQIDKIFQQATSKNQTKLLSVTTSNNTYSQNNNINNSTATYGDINQKYNNSLNINNNNNSSHHRHDNDKPHYNHNHNHNYNSNSKEKKSSKNSFYDYINSDDNIKRKLSDLDDAELDDIVESFEAKKQSNKKNINGSVSKSSSNSINKNHRDSKKQTSSSNNNNNNNNNSNIILSPISSDMLSPTPTESSKIPTSISPTLATPKITTATTTIATTTTSTSTSTTTAIKTVNQEIKLNQLEFPYKISSLNWDIDHLNNKENIYCYCGKNKERIMIRCDLCKQMFHVNCIKLLQGTHLYGDWVYRFSCSVCTDGNETFERFSKNWGDILEITLFNLQQNRIDQLDKWERKSPNAPSTFSCIKTNISDESNMDEVNFNNIKNNLTSVLKKGIYFHLDEEIIPFIEKNWNLLCSDKKKKSQWFKPLLPALTTGRIFKSGFINYTKKNMWALGTDQLLLKDNSMYKDVVLAPLHKKRKKKKSNEEEKRDKEVSRLLLIPSNVNNFVPTIEYDILCIAKENSAPQIKLIDNYFLTVSNDEGYRMARSSFPCVCGNWFFEIEILNSDGNSRLGWSSPKGDCQANVGYDQFSYAYRNLQGDIIHNARSKPYGEPYGKGDVIGFYISLPETSSTTQLERDFPFIDQLEIYDTVSKEYSYPQDQPLRDIIPNSFIQFFKNGVSPGPAFTNIGKSSYYPSASMYMKSMVRFNFGPNFKFPPNHLNFKPFCYIIKKDK